MKNKNKPGNGEPTNFPQFGPYGGFGNMGNMGNFGGMNGMPIPQMTNPNQNQNLNQPNMGNIPPFINPLMMGMRNPFFLQQNQQIPNQNKG